MKLTRTILAPATVLGLCIGLSGACGSKKPPGTNPPGETGGGDGGSASGSDGDGGSVSDGDGGDGGSASNGDGGDGGDGGDRPTTCDAKVADTPTLIFGDLVMLRPPVGVEFPPSDDPFTALAVMSSGFLSACDGNVKRVIITKYERDKKRKPAKLVEEFIKASLEPQGYTGGKKSGPYVDTDTDHHISLEYGAGGGSEAAVLYVAVSRRKDVDFVLVFETVPEDFGLLKPTFEESAKSILLVPQG
ncbi:MAG: hypothetical protein KDK70_36395 [Myxococcales bacterium]|nr:hypothetical protein [Myxococcales bacterium]